MDKGAEIGTHTVHSASTFDEVIVHFEEYAEQYGISNTHIDIMRQPDDAEVDISLTHSAKLLNVPKLVNVYFRLDSGYVWGGDHPGMSKEKEDAFFAEARRLFSEAGYEIKSIKYTECPGIVKEFTDLCIQLDYITFIGMVVIGSLIKRVVQSEIDQVFVPYPFSDFKRHIRILKEVDSHYIGFIFYTKGFHIPVVQVEQIAILIVNLHSRGNIGKDILEKLLTAI